jgi:hypothetical protein
MAIAHNMLWVAYELTRENDTTASRFLVIRGLVLENSADVRPSVEVIPTHRQGDLDPIVHLNNARMWIDWKHADDAFAFVDLRQEGWSDPVVHPWTDASWLGIESVRKEIQRRVMSRPALTDAAEADAE